MVLTGVHQTPPVASDALITALYWMWAGIVG
jgi:hypothetical protein